MRKIAPAATTGSGDGGRTRFGRPRRAQEPEVYGITTARTGQRGDVNRRARNYMVSMTIRLVCLVLAFVFFGSWEAWLFAGGAIILPYVAVLMANAGRERPAAPPTAMMTPEASSRPGGAPGPAPAPVRSIGAVPARTTPASDPWADPRASRATGSPRGRGAGSWQHSYAPPAGQAGHGGAGAQERGQRGARAS